MFRTDGYTTRMLQLARAVHVLNLDAGRFEVDGHTCRVGDINKCDCEQFADQSECIHIDAVGYVLDYGTATA